LREKHNANNYIVKDTQLNINLIDKVDKENTFNIRVILEDDLHDTEDGCEFPIYPVPIIDEKVTPKLFKSTVGSWYLGTNIMKKYFTVLDLNSVFNFNSLYLGVAECTRHMHRMNNYWTNYHTKEIND
jgi:hypothetical protein